MSRISYSDDEDYPGQFALWRSNLNRAMAGKRGQAALKDLREALLGLPKKRLIAHHLAKEGDVCTTGALVLFRRVKNGQDFGEALAEMSAEEEWCTCYHRRSQHADGGHCSGCERDVAWQAKYLAENPDRVVHYGRQQPQCERFALDDSLDEDEDQGEAENAAANVGVPKMVAWRLVELNDMELDRETPEERYEKVLRWVEKRLAGNPEPNWY